MMPYDEREQLLIWRSRSIGLGAALALAMACCVATAFFDLFQAGASWRLPTDSPIVAMWLLANTATGITTISASLMLPKKIADDEDE